MSKTKSFFKKILHPHAAVLISVPLASFAGTIFVLVKGYDKSPFAYAFFAAAAYSLLILVLFFIKLGKKIKKSLSTPPQNLEGKKKKAYDFAVHYKNDLSFKLMISLYRGAIVDTLYAIFRLATGIAVSSVWFIALGVYHLFLGLARKYLLNKYKKTVANPQNYGLYYEYSCYQKSAAFLFFINAAIGGIIFMTIARGAAFAYPEYVLYGIALYAFYAAISATVNLIRYKKLGSPVISAAKVISLAAACSSVYGLQTALLAAFSGGQKDFAKTMNVITGTAIYLFVCGIAVFMLIKAHLKKKVLTQNDSSGSGESGDNDFNGFADFTDRGNSCEETDGENL